MNAINPGPAVWRDALQTVLEALDIPYAATLGGEEIRCRVLDQRVLHTVIFLRSVLEYGDNLPSRLAGGDLAYFRERLAETRATGYRTWDQVRPARAGGAT